MSQARVGDWGAVQIQFLEVRQAFKRCQARVGHLRVAQAQMLKAGQAADVSNSGVRDVCAVRKVQAEKPLHVRKHGNPRIADWSGVEDQRMELGKGPKMLQTWPGYVNGAEFEELQFGHCRQRLQVRIG